MKTVELIEASDLPISSEGWENISNCSNITFGDANRSLFSVERILILVDFDDKADQLLFEKIQEVHGPYTYIDLEN